MLGRKITKYGHTRIHSPSGPNHFGGDISPAKVHIELVIGNPPCASDIGGDLGFVVNQLD